MVGVVGAVAVAVAVAVGSNSRSSKLKVLQMPLSLFGVVVGLSWCS